MYLKSIEIHGFKSFANKMVFEFKKGITAIVGPNGSGKSNVGDAVRWVLGEQSAKQLRGSKMEDIIFAGTELRKPQGFAYVAITFDNSDHKLPTSYEEVTVARRVYRSGESEYLMNGSNCRLRDVQELFLDTGIGKEGYSIIGQGQIDKILNGKPEERRELFDEAAGIVKYKKRKATAEKNLEAERQNLCRIEDILSELEKQVEPLKKQSETAKEYLHLRDELKKIDVNMFLSEYEILHKDITEVEGNLEIVSSDLEINQKKFQETKEEYERMEQQLEQRNLVLEQNRNQIGEKKIKKEQLEGEVKVCKEQILSVKQNEEHYKERLESISKDMKKKQEEKNKYIEEESGLFQGIQNMEQRKSDMENQLETCRQEIESIGAKIDECNHEIINSLNKNSNIKAKLEKYSTMLEQSNVKKAELTQKILKSKTEESICINILTTEEKNLQEFAKLITEKKGQVEKLTAEQSDLRRQLEKLREVMNQQQQSFHREKSRVEALRNMTERYDGYGQSIRRVMEQKEKNLGIIGVVADIIKVKKEYETAIEIALGGSIQNIVTDNENTAKNLIQFLKKNHFGRATFLPLSTVGTRSISKNMDVLKEEGVLGFANSLITADKKFNGLVEYLLGRIVVIDHIDHAITVSRKYKNTLRIVTLEGELLSPGGSMSGGAFKNSSNLLSRRREIEDSENALQKLEKQMEIDKRQLQDKQEEQLEVQKTLQDIQDKLQELYIGQNTAKLKYDQAKEESENIALQYCLIHKENSNMEGESQQLNQTIRELQGQIDENIKSSDIMEEQIGRYNKELEEKKKEEEQLRERVSKATIEFSSIENKKEYLKLNKERVESEIKELSKEYANIEQSLENWKNQILKKEQDIVAYKEELEIMEGEIKDLTDYVEKLSKEKEETVKSNKKLLEIREELSALMGNLDKELFRLKNRREKIEEQLEAKINYMWEEYELTYNSASSLQMDLGMELSVMKKMVSDLKGKMKGLGDVNVNAIEDYRNVSQRYELLYAQHQDLIHSEEVLKGIVEELDIEMRKQFEEKFAQIKKQFDIVFKELFGGGKGTIEIAEDEDILEAGITIIAQPPGKKLQNMMQMSGGEKALTAISLLFAIQNLKPSPFCLLDEIEAALDDSNVKRYAQYLHKLTKDTQFIVITHRRGTMAAADILYGITMQEKGVSTLVSVNLIEDQLDEME
ncbi:MAG: chromosome segregation protein SMC [Lachnospiraceae bacterium]|nr:chromosome segregation protein SMC [Lachnospiraceae bacterium]